MYLIPALLAPIFAITAAGVAAWTPADNHTTTPVPIRYCNTAFTPYPHLIDEFASYLRTLPSESIPPNMYVRRYTETINGTCLQLEIINWSCDHTLNVTGPGLANVLEGIAIQCDGSKDLSGAVQGPSGFGYYVDPDTGYDSTKHLWAVTTLCTSGYPKSACSPGA